MSPTRRAARTVRRSAITLLAVLLLAARAGAAEAATVACDGANGECSFPVGTGITWPISESGAASTLASFYVSAPVDPGTDYDQDGTDDREIIFCRGYNSNPHGPTANCAAKLDAAEYLFYEQLTLGWTPFGVPRRQGEWIFTHASPDGSVSWSPWHANFGYLTTNDPRFDLTIQTSPGRLGFQVTDSGACFGAACAGPQVSDMQAVGNGDVYLSGASGGGVLFEGTPDDSAQTRLTAADPAENRTIELPDRSGRILVVDPQTPWAGLLGWAADGITCTKACQAIGAHACEGAFKFESRKKVGCDRDSGTRSCLCS